MTDDQDIDFAAHVASVAKPALHIVFGVRGDSIRFWTANARHAAEWERDNGEPTHPYYSAPVAPAVPEGWRLVPVDMTPDMYRTAAVNGRYDPCTPAQLWAAMLAAAPRPTPAAVPSAEPVARIFCRTKASRFTGEPERHAELIDWDDGIESLPDGDHVLYAAPQPAAVPSAEPVAFDHDIGADRFTVVKGSFWWHIRIGGGTANVGKFHSRLAAEDVALKLLTAFRDGAYKQYHSAPQPAAVPQPLTEDQIAEMWSPHPGGAVRRPILGWGKVIDFARAIERAHGIGAAREPKP